MIIDCFTYFCEEDLLELKLETLWNSVDFFILVESQYTQARKQKPLYFKENKYKFTKYLSKIESVELNTFAPESAGLWANENFQRNNITTGIRQLINKGIEINSDTFFIIGDVDEQITAEALNRAISEYTSPTSFDLLFCSYYLNFVCNHRNWVGNVICKADDLLENSPQMIRGMKDTLPCINNAGWHFSNLGGFEHTWRKLNSCIEPENKIGLEGRKYEFRKIFEQHVINEKYFLFSDNLDNKTIKMDFLDKSKFPCYILDNFERFEHLMLPRNL